MILNINNEYGKLLKILLAPVDNRYLEQQKQLCDILSKYDIEIVMSNKCDNAKYQMFVRDPFIVIGDKIIMSCMKEECRKSEINSISTIMREIDDSKKIYAPDSVYIEGGDIIIHNNIIFVGQNGGRTNNEGLEFIKERFSYKYKVIPLYMVNPVNHTSWVHLDCLFNPLSSDTALIYKDGFDVNSFETLNAMFKKLIFVSDTEQSELATNVVSIGNNTVIMQKRHKKLIDEVEKHGFHVEIMNRYDTINEQGYTRCLTCPLQRI